MVEQTLDAAAPAPVAELVPGAVEPILQPATSTLGASTQLLAEAAEPGQAPLTPTVAAAVDALSGTPPQPLPEPAGLAGAPVTPGSTPAPGASAVTLATPPAVTLAMPPSAGSEPMAAPAGASGEPSARQGAPAQLEQLPSRAVDAPRKVRPTATGSDGRGGAAARTGPARAQASRDASRTEDHIAGVDDHIAGDAANQGVAKAAKNQRLARAATSISEAPLRSAPGSADSASWPALPGPPTPTRSAGLAAQATSIEPAPATGQSDSRSPWPADTHAPLAAPNALGASLGPPASASGGAHGSVAPSQLLLGLRWGALWQARPTLPSSTVLPNLAPPG
jgi:hypothetical protein